MRKKVCRFTAVALKACVAAIALVHMAASSLLAASPVIEATKKEGKLVFWCPPTAKEMEPVFNKFRQKYPFVLVEYWRASSSDVNQKFNSEARAGVYNPDLVCTDIEFLADVRKAGLMKKHDWPSAKIWPSGYKDPEGYWVARHVVVTVIGYNSQSVQPTEAPKRWEDLLDAKWKGQISIPKDYDWVPMMWAAWGKEKTLAYLKELSKNSPVLGPGHTARTEMIAAGASKIDVRLALNTLLAYRAKGAPLDWVRTDPIFAKGTPFFIAERAPHPNTALLFADWYTSLEGQQAYQDSTGYMMPHPEVKSPITEALKGLNVVMMPASMAVHGNEIAKIYSEIFWK